jgi:tetratricopeptide (TPR) repeat protein
MRGTGILQPPLSKIIAPNLKAGAARYFVYGCTLLFLLFFGGSPPATAASEATEKYSNVDLCNGVDRSSPEPQTKGCTALIDAGGMPNPILAIAYNNRGDAYSHKAEFDLAIKDYDMAIKLNPTDAVPFNNRGAAYLSKGEYTRYGVQ